MLSVRVKEIKEIRLKPQKNCKIRIAIHGYLYVVDIRQSSLNLIK